MKKTLLLTLPALLISLSSGAAIAQQRVVEESLVYDDPTVAKPGKWLFGAAVGAYYSNGNTAGNDTSGNTVYASQQYTQPQASAYIGYEDITLLMRYQKSKSTTQFPGNTAQMDGSTYSIDLRWLISQLGTKHFVPYVLATYAQVTENTTFSYVNSSGLRQTGKSDAKGPGLGFGGIIPITEKYGIRADARQYNAKSDNSSNMFSAFNTSTDIQYRQFQATAYYNITEKINLQVGGQSTYIVNRPESTSYGMFSQIGYSF